jgi:hypothetical protein
MQAATEWRPLAREPTIGAMSNNGGRLSRLQPADLHKTIRMYLAMQRAQGYLLRFGPGRGRGKCGRPASPMEPTRPGPAIPIDALFDSAGIGPNALTDARQAICRADVIIGRDVTSGVEFVVYGRATIERTASPARIGCPRASRRPVSLRMAGP